MTHLAVISPGFFVFSLLLISSLTSRAQLCEGSLGDPIVNINFGSGTSVHGSSLPSGTTSYSWSTDDFPLDGSYTIENSTAGSGDQWWSTTDHTGNTGGYMMVVNASISTTDYFYTTTITGLCPGTLYEFAAWVMNLLRSQDLNPPNITFMIEKTDGTLLNSYTTGDIALQSSPVWKQYGFYFSTPDNVTSVVVVMRNNSAGGMPANDIALDDITFRPCGPDLSCAVDGSSAVTDTLCAGTDLIVTFEGAVSEGYDNPQFQWQQWENGDWQDIPWATSLHYSLSFNTWPEGTYQFRLTAGDGSNISSMQCRVISNILSICILPQPVAGYGYLSPVLCSNQPVQFMDSTISSVSLSYSWDFGDGATSSEQNPSHLYLQSGSYYTSLVVNSSGGCSDTSALTVDIQLLPVPEANFTVTPTTTSIFTPVISFSDESVDAITCLIDWGDGTITDCNTFQHTYASPGTYRIKQIVENTEGCTDTAFATVIINAEFRFYIPTAFTPNGDGLNDTFKPVMIGVHDYHFKIFNRWGQILFETSDQEEGWNGYCNGRICPADTYVYKIICKDDVVNSEKIYSGHLILIN